MFEESQIHCPYCKEWKDIDGSQPPRGVVGILILLLMGACIYLVELMRGIGIPTGPSALYVGTGILAALIMVGVLLLEIFRKKEKWYVFLDGEDQFHIHDEDPLHGLAWRRWRCEHERGEPNPLIQFSANDPDECIVRMDDQEVSCLVRVVWIQGRDLVLEDTYGNRISGRSISLKNPSLGLLTFIREHLSLGDMLKNFDGAMARVSELEKEVATLQEERDRCVASLEKMPSNVIQIFPKAKEKK